MSQSTNNLATYIWSLADLLRGDFKQSQYGRIILPFTLLRRLECVLEKSKENVLVEYKNIKKKKLPEEAEEKLLLRATNKLSFFNTSQMDLSKLGETDIKDNLISYIQGFSKDAREIFEHFKFVEFIDQLNDANLLYKIVQKVRLTDLSPKAISNYEMGLVFEELIRRFAESSNETAGEHFTPRDIVHLTTSLVFMEDDDLLTKQGVIRTVYDPTAGTGGFLSSGMEYVHKLNPDAVIRAFGQELNPESYAICKADMLIKGQDVSNIKLGNTLSDDQLYSDKFDYMLSNPPFGVDWKKIEKEVNDEHTLKGFNGRFGAGLPRVSDGSLLFLLHLISKLRDKNEGGGRIGIILNGSPLFTGGAGSGESEIRRYILEGDMLEAIIALPTDMFYNTGISTYIWILSNKKSKNRKGKVQLINGVNLYSKKTKSLGSKRNEMTEEDIANVTRCFGNFESFENVILNKPVDAKSNKGRPAINLKIESEKTFSSKVFNVYEFGYRKITIERPLRESFQFSDDRLEELKFLSNNLFEPMKWIYAEYGQNWSNKMDCKNYGILDKNKDEIRKRAKTHFEYLKESQIKELFDKKIWIEQKKIYNKAKELQKLIGTNQHDDMNEFDTIIEKTGIKLEANEKKQLLRAISWKNPSAKKVIKRTLSGKANPIYGTFTSDGQVVEYKSDGDLRDYETIPLDPSNPVNSLIEQYFKKEVLPHLPDSWIDADSKDKMDNEIGIVGYDIPFNKHFYTYHPPRELSVIDKDLNSLSREIMNLLEEAQS